MLLVHLSSNGLSSGEPPVPEFGLLSAALLPFLSLSFLSLSLTLSRGARRLTAFRAAVRRLDRDEAHFYDVRFRRMRRLEKTTTFTALKNGE